MRRDYSKYDPRVHISERLGQWTEEEPALEAESRDALRVAWRRLGAPTRFGKSTVARIIKESGLATRRYLEKWLSIRRFLVGRKRVMPDNETVDAMREDSHTFISAWLRHADVRRGRKNIINLNFLFHQLLLRRGARIYELHKLDFPQVKASNAISLLRRYAAVCQYIGWRVYLPIRIERPSWMTGANITLLAAPAKRQTAADGSVVMTQTTGTKRRRRMSIALAAQRRRF